MSVIKSIVLSLIILSTVVIEGCKNVQDLSNVQFTGGLLGITVGQPTLDFGGSGEINYNASTGVVTITGTPAILSQDNPFLFGVIAL